MNSTNSINSINSPLSGYRVLDLTDEKGAFCARLLADMGAEVIRVDQPGTDVKDNLSFHVENAGKLDITLDIEAKKGQSLFKRLVKTADIVIESYPPGYLDSLGLGYTKLSKINPKLIMASITGFGQSGPYRDYKASDIVAGALGGWMAVCGEPGAPPLKPSGNQANYTACLFAANGILLALYQRHATGKGQHIDIAVMDCVAATLDHVLVRYFYEGEVAERRGKLYWNDAFSLFPCLDGYILLAMLYQWETLVVWLESEGMAEDLAEAKWQDADYRHEHVDHIVEVLERWTKNHTVAELVEKGQLMRFPWAPVSTIPELVNSPQLAERNFFVGVAYPGSDKKYKHAGVPCKLSRSPWQVGNRVPGIGEHNMTVYRRLGLSKEEIEALLKEGVI